MFNCKQQLFFVIIITTYCISHVGVTTLTKQNRSPPSSLWGEIKMFGICENQISKFVFLVMSSSTAGTSTSQKYPIHTATHSSPTNKSRDHFTYSEVYHCVLLPYKRKIIPEIILIFLEIKIKATHVVLIATKHKIYLILFLYISYTHSLHYLSSLSFHSYQGGWEEFMSTWLIYAVEFDCLWKERKLVPSRPVV